MAKKLRTPQTFPIGEKVIVTSTINRRLKGKHGVICKVQESRHDHTLDRYTVCVEPEKEEVVLWDIELQRQT